MTESIPLLIIAIVLGACALCLLWALSWSADVLLRGVNDELERGRWGDSWRDGRGGRRTDDYSDPRAVADANT